MCTAATYRTLDHYFGRNLDLSFDYDETVTVTPRNFPLQFKKMNTLESHYAMLGVAVVAEGCPLYFDATNEKGLSIAGLHFPENAVYFPEAPDRDNVAPYELPLWLLGQCATVRDARWLLERVNLLSVPFNDRLQLEPLHWMVADRECSIVVESVQEGLRVYDNPFGVLTNNPPFEFQRLNLNNFMNLTRNIPVNRFCPSVELSPYSLGFGAIGLPGDLSSTSRFVRAAFTRLNSVSGNSEAESVSQFFHILGSVAQTRGCAQAGSGYEATLYSSCCNTDKGVYYYTSYGNSQVTAVDLHRENLNAGRLVSYPLVLEQQIRWQN